MARWTAMAALLLAISLALPARADDTDCLAGLFVNGSTLLTTQPARVISACRHLAERGNGIGGFVLGFLYEHGFGVSKDYVAAWMWYDSAVGHGVTDARGGDAAVPVRDDLAKRMTPSQIEQAKALEAAWKPKTGQ